MAKPQPRAVIVSGVRTPFVKAFAQFMELDTIALGCRAVAALIDRSGLPRKELDAIIWGGVVLPSAAPNVGREIALDLRLGGAVEAYTVTRACVSGLQAVTNAVAQIERGEADVIIAGGSESTSNAEVKLPQKVVHTLAPVAFGKATPADILQIAPKLFPLKDILPKMPKIAERTTGQVMGQSAEEMARRNDISREAQDVFAVGSHHKAAAGIASGRLTSEVVPVDCGNGKWVHGDTIVRGDTSVEKLAKLKPAFAKDGSVTAGNSSALTDGASAVLIMNEDKAKALGLKPLARLLSSAYVGVDPSDQLLMGPAIAIPKALKRAGLELKDMDFVDLHEAFAAQVLSVLKMLGSKAFAETRLGQATAVGDVDPKKLNVYGGSIALGHPFGATGPRQVTTMANELAARGGGRAVIGMCAAGGLGGACILEGVS